MGNLGKKKLTIEEIEGIRRMSTNGFTVSEIAEAEGRPYQTVYTIVKRRKRKYA